MAAANPPAPLVGPAAVTHLLTVCDLDGNQRNAVMITEGIDSVDRLASTRIQNISKICKSLSSLPNNRGGRYMSTCPWTSVPGSGCSGHSSGGTSILVGSQSDNVIRVFVRSSLMSRVSLTRAKHYSLIHTGSVLYSSHPYTI